MTMWPQRNPGHQRLAVPASMFPWWSSGSFLCLDPLSPLWTCSHFTLLFQGFDDVALTPGKAAMIIHNYEVWTGHIVSMAKIESGYCRNA